ncbi:MAG: class I SAM-dependent methyltransferase [Oscillospiraceae bacterium]|nr:class I SAM-dependent methyltransferase [Oscillospiraceae bacterium]
MSILNMKQINEMVLSAYNSIADSYAGAYSENDETDSKYFDYFIKHLPGKKILDMGCGVGTNTSFLTNKGFKVTGIDASENMLKNAQRLYPVLTFEKQNILHTSFPNGFFDGIVLAYVIEHFNDEGLLQLRDEIMRLLSNGGLLFIISHEGDKEEIIPDPLNENVSIYYNFLTADKIDSLFSSFQRVSCYTRPSYGPEEFLCDKMFITYQKRAK